MNAHATFAARPSENWCGWTDENVQYLREKAADRRSAAEIARELGTSRNAVIGKATRMGLQLMGGPGGPLRRSPLPRPPSPVVRLRETVPAKRVEDFGSITILGLQDGVCPFPYGEPRDLDTFRYCGAQIGEGERYCAGHCRVMYQPRLLKKAS